MILPLLHASMALAATLEVSGTCPGTVTYRVGATARASVALLQADELGGTAIPTGVCAGAVTGLEAPTLAGVRAASARGVATFQRVTAATDCDRLVQAVELGSCDLTPALRQGPAPDYALPGPWEVGSVVLPVTGRSGVSLPSELWFPAANRGASPRIYRTQGYPDGVGIAATDVAPACAGPRPVLVHSHGNQSLPFESFEIMEHLASHGWIVLAPEHTGNSWHAQGGSIFEIPYRRPRDVADAYDALIAEASRPGSPLQGCVDPDDGYVVSGNSFGGYTAYATGGALVNDPFFPTLDLSDARVRAIVTYVPWDVIGLLSSGTSNVDVPVLTFGGERDGVVGTAFRSLFSHVRSEPRVRYSFPDGGHFSFTPLWCVSPGEGCGRAFVDTDVAVATAWTAALSFLEHLRGRDGAVDQLPAAGPFNVLRVGLP
jgi:predicted dienelactone hydrolase